MERFPPFSWENEQRPHERDVFDAYDERESQLQDMEDNHDKNDLGARQER